MQRSRGYTPRPVLSFVWILHPRAEHILVACDHNLILSAQTKARDYGAGWNLDEFLNCLFSISLTQWCCTTPTLQLKLLQTAIHPTVHFPVTWEKDHESFKLLLLWYQFTLHSGDTVFTLATSHSDANHPSQGKGPMKPTEPCCLQKPEKHFRGSQLRHPSIPYSSSVPNRTTKDTQSSPGPQSRLNEHLWHNVL